MCKFVAVIVFRFPPTILFVAANVFRFGPPSRSCAEQIESWGCCSLPAQRKPQGTWPASGPGADLPLGRRRLTRASASAAFVPGGTAFWALAPFGVGSAFPLHCCSYRSKPGCLWGPFFWLFSTSKKPAGSNKYFFRQKNGHMVVQPWTPICPFFLQKNLFFGPA